MEQKTKISAEDGEQELMITREFDLPLELLFKAYVESDIVEQWMGTKVLKLEIKDTAAGNLRPLIQKETNTDLTGQSMSLFQARKSREHLKWRMQILVSSLSSWNLTRYPMMLANSICISYIDRWLSEIRYCSFLLRRVSIWLITDYKTSSTN